MNLETFTMATGDNTAPPSELDCSRISDANKVQYCMAEDRGKPAASWPVDGSSARGANPRYIQRFNHVTPKLQLVPAY